MTLPLALLIGLWLHMIGDYITQNDWMATNKTRNTMVATLHGTIYSLPFLLITGDSWWWGMILITHILIDRYRLATLWIRLVNWNWTPAHDYRGGNFGFDPEKPKWMSVWLMIIIDNIFHITFNSIAIWASF